MAKQYIQPKQLQPEDFDESLEEAHELPEDWIDAFLSWGAIPMPGPRRGMSFRILGRNRACSMPMWAIEEIDDEADRRGMSRSFWLECAALQALYFSHKADRESGPDSTTLSRCIAINKHFRAAREMRMIEEVLENLEADLQFWIGQQASDPIAKDLSMLVEAVEPTKDKDLRLAKIRYVTSKWQWVPSGLALLKATNHNQHKILEQAFDKWEKEGIYES